MNRRKLLQLAMASIPGSYLAACGASSSTGLSDSALSDILAGDIDGQPLLVLPSEGEMTTGEMLIKVPSSSMSGHFSIMHGELDGLQLLPPHTHEFEDQAVYVLEGELAFEFAGNGEIITAPAGSYVIKPRNVQHAFWNPGSEKVSYVEYSTEDGFEGYVRDVEGPESVPELELKYGVSHNMLYSVELVKTHGLTSIHRVTEEDFNLLMSMA